MVSAVAEAVCVTAKCAEYYSARAIELCLRELVEDLSAVALVSRSEGRAWGNDPLCRPRESCYHDLHSLNYNP
jgi:hypothetical protein